MKQTNITIKQKTAMLPANDSYSECRNTINKASHLPANDDVIVANDQRLLSTHEASDPALLQSLTDEELNKNIRQYLFVSDGVPKITSNVVAKLFGRLHKDVMRSVNNIVGEDNIGVLRRNFTPGLYSDAQGQERPCFHMTRDGFLLLVLGFTGEKANAFKLQMIEVFNNMEDELRMYEEAGLRLSSPVLLDALFTGDLSILAAKNFQKLPEKDQKQILKRPISEMDRAIKLVRKRIAKKNAAERAIIRAAGLACPLPNGKYRTIVMDPPWNLKRSKINVTSNSSKFDYPTMSEDELSNLRVGDIAHQDCHLYLWTTQGFLEMAFRLMKQWEVSYKFLMVWHKEGGMQPSNYPQYNCEFVLFGSRGNLPFSDTKAFPTCFYAKRREHSRKPDNFYDLVRRVSPGPRIDMFSREERSGYDTWGAESGKFINDIQEKISKSC